MTESKCRAAIFVIVSLVLFHHTALARTDLSSDQAKTLIESTPDLIIVDVREHNSEFCEDDHIPCAVNYPWNSGVLEQRYSELPQDAPILVV